LVAFIGHHRVAASHIFGYMAQRVSQFFQAFSAQALVEGDVK